MNLGLFISALIIPTDSFLGNKFKLIFYIYGALFAKLNGLVQISHLSKMLFSQNRISIVFLSLFVPINIISYYFGILNITVLNLTFLVSIVSSFVAYIYFFVKVTGELCYICNIKRFSLTKQ